MTELSCPQAKEKKRGENRYKGSPRGQRGLTETGEVEKGYTIMSVSYRSLTVKLCNTLSQMLMIILVIFHT